ncbi:MAG TPA: hypothetical protein VJS13_16115 [Pyrinomonadaceae bacterium]|nr:hypothetical protein [Pyrinomonadaceae bacterium]
MVTLLITSILALGLIAIAIYFWQKPAKTTETIELPPPPHVDLFSDREPKQIAAAAEEEEQAERDEHAHSDELEAKKALAEEFIDAWQVSPDRVSTAKMLHLAALADDADTFRTAVETALNVWQRGSVPDLSAAELQTLFNSEFWILSSAARSSGAGFVLKRTLSRAKRELERANNRT